MSLGDLIREKQKPIIAALESPLRMRQTIEYEDLDADPDMRNRIVRWFYSRLKDKWLYDNDEIRSLSRYFLVKDDKVILIANADQYKDPSFKIEEPEKNVLLKLDYIRKHLVHKRRVARVLEKYVNRINKKNREEGVLEIHWWDLEKDHWKDIRHALYQELRRKILQSIDAKIALEDIKTKKPPSVVEDEASGELWED